MTVKIYKYSVEDNMMMFHFNLKNSKESVTMLVNEIYEKEIITQINDKGFINWIDIDGNYCGINTESIESYKSEKFSSKGIIDRGEI